MFNLSNIKLLEIIFFHFIIQQAIILHFSRLLKAAESRNGYTLSVYLLQVILLSLYKTTLSHFAHFPHSVRPQIWNLIHGSGFVSLTREVSIATGNHSYMCTNVDLQQPFGPISTANKLGNLHQNYPDGKTVQKYVFLVLGWTVSLKPSI